MTKTRLAALLMSLIMTASMAACTEESLSESEKAKDPSSSSQVSSEADSSEQTTTSASETATTTSTQEETTTTTTTTEETTTTAEQTTASETTATEATTKAAPQNYFTDAIKKEVESCRANGTVDVFKLLQKWDIQPGQVGYVGNNGSFIMQARRNEADTETEGFVISAKKDTTASYGIHFGTKANSYPVYKCVLFEAQFNMTGYDFAALFKAAKNDDYSLCTKEPYVDMSIRYE